MSNKNNTRRAGWTDCNYLDLKKAFDKVSHKRSLWKLEDTVGLKGKVKKVDGTWFGRKRNEKCDVRGRSQCKKVTSGVPQGSLLAPFILYKKKWVRKYFNDQKLVLPIEI